MARIRPLLMILAVSLIAGCGDEHLSFLDPQGPVAEQQRGHFLLILGLVAIVVVPVLVLTPLLLWRYRYGARTTYRPAWGFSWGLEALIWGLPVLVATVLAVFLWINTTDLEPWDPLADRSPPLRVQVVGYDWKWLFIYPEQNIATVNELVFPSDRQLALRLTSETVMQSFLIPALGSQVYAMGGGMVTRLHLKADGPGVFPGRNTQYNGKGFHEQKFEARAAPAKDFAAWVEDVRRTGVPLDDRARSVLETENTGREAARKLIAGDPPPGGVIRFSEAPGGFFEGVVGRAAGVAGAGATRTGDVLR